MCMGRRRWTWTRRARARRAGCHTSPWWTARAGPGPRPSWPPSWWPRSACWRLPRARATARGCSRWPTGPGCAGGRAPRRRAWTPHACCPGTPSRPRCPPPLPAAPTAPRAAARRGPPGRSPPLGRGGTQGAPWRSCDRGPAARSGVGAAALDHSRPQRRQANATGRPRGPQRSMSRPQARADAGARATRRPAACTHVMDACLEGSRLQSPAQSSTAGMHAACHDSKYGHLCAADYRRPTRTVAAAGAGAV
mmetsp:Transcript_1485/g.4661  ORF Transcript_1485/g.4661 Transcript_1485/m.4661 type:complete len:251 (+) Transcript_1485:364-1116(+)